LVVSTGYELNGRVAQKRRTRDALIHAARQLIADGGAVPTVEAAAEAASISRTTAYRYFPSQRALLVAAHPETALESLLPDNAPDDVAARLALAIDALTKIVVATEPQARTMLRLSLEADPEERSQLALRQGRAIKWIEEALAPLRPGMSAAEVHRLAIAIRSATGIEALVWLTDIAGLSRDDAAQLMRWSAHAMLTTALLDRTATARKQPGKRASAPARA
jgi:AcrR family transcriptional regulator